MVDNTTIAIYLFSRGAEPPINNKPLSPFVHQIGAQYSTSRRQPNAHVSVLLRDQEPLSDLFETRILEDLGCRSSPVCPGAYLRRSIPGAWTSGLGFDHG